MVCQIVLEGAGYKCIPYTDSVKEAPNLVLAYNNSVTGTGDVLKSLLQGLNKQIKPDFECPRCQNAAIS